MLLRFAKLHCLGDDLMLVDHLGQQVQIDPTLVQQWSKRTQGVGFKRLVLVGVPRAPDADFSCRSFDRYGQEVDSHFADLCSAARFLHDKRLTNQPKLQIETRSSRIRLHVRGDGWIAADYDSTGHVSGGHPLEPQLLQHLQRVSERHSLQLNWQVCGQQLAVWSDQAPPLRLHRLLQPVVRELRGWQLLWLYSHERRIRVHGWQGADADLAGHDPARLIASQVRRNVQLPVVQVEWQQECLLLEFSPQQDSVQLFARAWPVYEGQIRL